MKGTISLPEGPIHLYDPAAGHASLTIADIDLKSRDEFQDRTNYFALCLVRAGRGRFFVDAAEYRFRAPSVLCFSPYQNHQIETDTPLTATLVRFHANFLCIETYHDEIGCNGVLFNDVYGVPAVELGAAALAETDELIGRIRSEMRDNALAKTELLLSYLKVLLIKLSRLKREQQAAEGSACSTRLPAELEALRELVEANYARLHTPAAYARLLHVTPKTLGKIVKAHLHKTLTELIRERILRQAKWELLHTLKPVKQIARELGYTDELYFSRLFKRATGCSPTFFREFETAVRSGRNLSMTSAQSSIPESSVESDTVGSPMSNTARTEHRDAFRLDGRNDDDDEALRSRSTV
jgi:AraC-like DNA-binding protein